MMESLPVDVDNRINGEFKSLFFKLQMEYQRQSFQLKQTQVKLAQERAKRKEVVDDTFALTENNARLTATLDEYKMEIQSLRAMNEALKSTNTRKELENAYATIAQRDEEIKNLKRIPNEKKCPNCSISDAIHQESLEMAKEIDKLKREVERLTIDTTNNISKEKLQEEIEALKIEKNVMSGQISEYMKLNEDHQNRLVSQIRHLKQVSEKKEQDLMEWNKYLSFLSASLFNSYEKAQDILWIAYVELENEHLKRLQRDIGLEMLVKPLRKNLLQSDISINLKDDDESQQFLNGFKSQLLEFFDVLESRKLSGIVPNDESFTQPISSKILEMIKDTKFIKGLLVTIINSSGHDAMKALDPKAVGNVNIYQQLYSEVFEEETGILASDSLKFEPFLIIDSVISSAFPEKYVENISLLSDEKSGYHHSFFAYAQKKEREIAELKYKLAQADISETAVLPMIDNFKIFKDSNILFIEENLKLLDKVDELESKANHVKTEDSDDIESSVLRSRLQVLEEMNYALRLQIAELKFKSVSQLDVLADGDSAIPSLKNIPQLACNDPSVESMNEIHSTNDNCVNTDFDVIRKTNEIYLSEIQQLKTQNEALIAQILKGNMFQRSDTSLSDIDSKIDGELRSMHVALENMDSKLNSFVKSSEKSTLSQQIEFANQCLQELRNVKKTFNRFGESYSHKNSVSVESSVKASIQDSNIRNDSKSAYVFTRGKENGIDRLYDSLAWIKPKDISNIQCLKEISSAATQVSLEEPKLSEKDKDRLWVEIHRLNDELASLEKEKRKINQENADKSAEILDLKCRLQHYEIAYEGSQKEIMRMATEESEALKERSRLVQSLQEANQRVSEMEILKNEAEQKIQELIREITSLRIINDSSTKETSNIYEIFLETQAEEQDYLILNKELTNCLEGLQVEFKKLDNKLYDKMEINKALNEKLQSAHKIMEDLSQKHNGLESDLLEKSKSNARLSSELEKARQELQNLNAKFKKTDFALKEETRTNTMLQLSLNQARELIEDLRDRSRKLEDVIHDKSEINEILSAKSETDKKYVLDIQNRMLQTESSLFNSQTRLTSLQEDMRKLQAELSNSEESNKSLTSQSQEYKSYIQNVEKELKSNIELNRSLNIRLSESASARKQIEEEMKVVVALNESLNLRLKESQTMAQELDNKLEVSNISNTSLNSKILELQTVIEQQDQELRETLERNSSLDLQLCDYRSRHQKVEEDLKAKNDLNQSLEIKLSESLAKSVALDCDLRAKIELQQSVKLREIDLENNIEKLSGNLKDIEDVNQVLKIQVTKLQEDIQNLDEELNSSRSLIESLNHRLTESQARILKLQEELIDATELKESLVAQLSESQTKHHEDLMAMSKLNESLELRLSQSQADLKKLDEELNMALEMNRELNCHYSKSQENAQKLHDDLHSKNEASLRLDMELKESQVALQRMEMELVDLHRLNEFLNLQLGDERLVAQNLNDELKSATETLKTLQIKLTESQAVIHNFEKDKMTGDEYNEKISTELAESRSIIIRLDDELKAAKELNQSLRTKLTESESISQQLDKESTTIKDLNQLLNFRLSESQSVIDNLEDEMRSTVELNQSINFRLSESQSALQKSEEKLRQNAEIIGNLNLQLSQSQSNVHKMQDELKDRSELNLSLNMKLKEYEASFQKNNEELEALHSQLNESQEHIAKYQKKLKGLKKEILELSEVNQKYSEQNEKSKINKDADAKHILALERSISALNRNYESSCQRLSMMIRENSDLKGSIADNQGQIASLKMENSVLDQKLSKLQKLFQESKELLQIPIIVSKLPPLEVKETLPELTPPIDNMNSSNVKELEKELSEFCNQENEISDSMSNLTERLSKLATEKCEKKRNFIKILQSVQSSNSGENGTIAKEPPEDHLSEINDKHMLEIKEINNLENEIKSQLSQLSASSISLKERKREIAMKLNECKRQEAQQKNFLRNQLNRFNNEYLRDVESLNLRRSELFNNLQNFEHALESLMTSKIKLESAYKSSLEKLEKDSKHSSDLYNSQLKILNFSFDTEFMILNGKEDSMKESIKKIKSNIQQLEEAKENFQEMRKDAEKHIQAEFRDIFAESISDVSQKEVIETFNAPVVAINTNYHDNVIVQQLSQTVGLLISQSDENRLLDEIAFMCLKDGYEARIVELNKLKDETIKLLNDAHSEAMSRLSNNLSNLSKEYKQKEDKLRQEIEILKQEYKAQQLATETIIADQEHIIGDSSEKIEQFKKESDNYQLIMANIMDLQAREVESISLRESMKFKRKLKNILDNAHQLKSQKEAMESKFQTFRDENIALNKRLDELNISNSHLSKQNELLSHELQDFKIKLRIKSMEELEHQPNEKSVEEKERILRILTVYKGIESKLKADISHLSSVDSETISKEVLYFVQIGYEIFIEALEVIIQYLSADLGIFKNSCTELSEIHASKIGDNILPVENILMFANRIFSQSQESASLYQFVSKNETFKSSLKAQYDGSSIKPSPSVQCLIDEGFSKQLHHKVLDGQSTDLSDIIYQRDYYRNALEGLQKELDEVKKSEKILKNSASQTEFDSRNVSIQTDGCNTPKEDAHMQTSPPLIYDENIQTSRIIYGDTDMQTSRILCGETIVQTNDVFYGDADMQTSRIIYDDADMQTNEIICQETSSQVNPVIREFSSQTELDIEKLKQDYQDEIDSLRNDLDMSISQKNFLKSSFKHSQEEQSKAYRLAESLRIEKERIAAEKEQMSKQIPILESVKYFVEQSFEQSQEELGKARSHIEKLNQDIESISDEKRQIKEELAKNQSILSKLKVEYGHIERQYKSSDMAKNTAVSRLAKSNEELARVKSELTQMNKNMKKLESEKSLFDTRIESLTSQLNDSVKDANGLRDLYQKLLTDYNALVDQLFLGNTKQIDDSNLSTVTKDLNSLLDDARSNEISIAGKLKERNATISQLSEKIRIANQEKIDNENNYQKAINELSLKHAQALEAKDRSIVILEDIIAQNKIMHEKLSNELMALESKEENLEKNLQIAKGDYTTRLNEMSVSMIKRQKDSEVYVKNLFTSLEDSIEKSGKSAAELSIKSMIESLQMRILKPDFNKSEDSKILFRSISPILIGLESLLSRLQVSVSTRTEFLTKKLDQSVSIMSGIVNATSFLENLLPLAKILTERTESLKNSLLDEGVDLTIDLKLQSEFSEAIKKTFAQTKQIRPIQTKFAKKALPSPKDSSPETPLIKDILGTHSIEPREPYDASWIIDEDLKRVHEITKQSLADTIGTFKTVYKTSDYTLPLSTSMLNEDDLAQVIDASSFDLEMANMKSVTNKSLADTLSVANSLKKA